MHICVCVYMYVCTMYVCMHYACMYVRVIRFFIPVVFKNKLE